MAGGLDGLNHAGRESVREGGDLRRCGVEVGAMPRQAVGTQVWVAVKQWRGWRGEERAAPGVGGSSGGELENLRRQSSHGLYSLPSRFTAAAAAFLIRFYKLRNGCRLTILTYKILRRTECLRNSV
ncbi:uncharacterized protein LOC119366023 [Triticum dicoccoides]|uniref:uncharacterized protein LOC119366023 n=1 Tax=Triticum dicoccoides TaxID=85692 RepID=UPI00188F2F45|nr:uncharacterized protein LOC119366023 [Triticum dicoccoides]